MSMNTAQPHPHELREAARLAKYPNSVVERETLERLDQAVFDRVRNHEQALLQNARTLMEDAAVDEEAVTLIATQLAEDVRYPLRDGAAPSAELAERYERLRNLADAARKSLARAERDAGFMADKVADPYADLMSLYDRWPAIRPTIA